MRTHDELLTAAAMVQMRTRRTAPVAPFDAHVEAAHAFLMSAVDILDVGMAGLLRRLDEPAIERGQRLLFAHAHTAGVRPKGIRPTLEAFRSLEIRQALGERPAAAAVVLCPSLVIAGMAPQESHAIDRGGTAQHLAARLGDTPVVERRLRHTFEPPVVATARLEDRAQPRRHSKHPVAVVATGLNQQHAVPAVFTKAVRKRASGCSRANDDIIECFVHAIPIAAYVCRFSILAGRTRWRFARQGPGTSLRVRAENPGLIHCA